MLDNKEGGRNRGSATEMSKSQSRGKHGGNLSPAGDMSEDISPQPSGRKSVKIKKHDEVMEDDIIEALDS